MLCNSMDVAHNDGSQDCNADTDEAGNINADAPSSGQVTAAAGDDNAAQSHGGTDGQVDLTGNDNHGHTESDNALQCLVTENVHNVVDGHKVLADHTHDNNQNNQQDLNDMIQQQVLYFVLIHTCSSPILSAYN